MSRQVNPLLRSVSSKILWVFVIVVAQMMPGLVLAESNSALRPIVVLGDLDLGCEMSSEDIKEHVGRSPSLAHRYIDAIANGNADNLREILADDGTREDYRGAIISSDALRSAYRNVKNLRCMYSVKFDGITIFRMQKILAIKAKDKEVMLPRNFLLAKTCKKNACFLTSRFADAFSVDAMFVLYEQGVVGFSGKSVSEDKAIRGKAVEVVGRFSVFGASDAAQSSLPVRVSINTGKLSNANVGSIKTAAKENGKSYFRYQASMSALAQTVPGFRLFSQDIKTETLAQFGVLSISPKKPGQKIGVFKLDGSDLVQFLPFRCAAETCQLEGIDFEDPVWAFLNQISQVDPTSVRKR